MFTDILGNTRQKVGLHVHTTRSDGRKTPEEALALFQEAGYDAVALTDHWKWNPNGKFGDMTVLAGVELDCRTNDGAGFAYGAGVYHITAIGCKEEPQVNDHNNPRFLADAIHKAGGLAVLAHPAWSLNDPSVVAEQNFYDATEIYNSVSGVHASCRPDSSAFVDLLACRGVFLPLIAADDCHYYDNDATISWVCAQAADNSPEAILTALRQGTFYATQGPEIHFARQGDKLIVHCSEASEVFFHSNVVWVADRAVRGEKITYAEYPIHQNDRFVRAEVVDARGRHAWSNFISID